MRVPGMVSAEPPRFDMDSRFEQIPTDDLLIMLWIVIGESSYIEQYLHIREAILELATRTPR